MALVRSDPFRDVDRLFQQLWNSQQSGPRPMAMPMDAYRKDDSFLLQLDLPGVASESIELSVEDNVLTISAERPAPPSGEGVEPVISERTFGMFSRQVVLGKTLDAERIEANYEGGVLTVAIPVAEQAKPRRIEVRTSSEPRNSRRRPFNRRHPLPRGAAGAPRGGPPRGSAPEVVGSWHVHIDPPDRRKVETMTILAPPFCDPEYGQTRGTPVLWADVDTFEGDSASVLLVPALSRGRATNH